MWEIKMRKRRYAFEKFVCEWVDWKINWIREWAGTGNGDGTRVSEGSERVRRFRLEPMTGYKIKKKRDQGKNAWEMNVGEETWTLIE